MLLFQNFDGFENAAVAKWTDDPLLQREFTQPILMANESFSGHVDNVFSYLEFEDPRNADSHRLLEKIRILQICQTEKIESSKLQRRLMDQFGYNPSAFNTQLLLLMKSGFIEASLVANGDKFTIVVSCSKKGLLCINSLIFNLSYLEHVFHKTKFPEKLIADVNDKPRSADLAGWIAHSIRNVHIFMNYIKFVETNRASGKTVPEKYRISGQVKLGIQAALDRMIGFGNPDAALKSEESVRSNELVKTACNTAERLIAANLSKWRIMQIRQIT